MSKTAKSESPKRSAIPTEGLARATGADNEQLQIQRLNGVLKTIWLSDSRDEKASHNAIAAVLASLKNIAPLDELEGMLAAQMVATHNTAMECLRRSILPDQTFEGRQENLKHAAKFFGLYTKQLEALDKHRSLERLNLTVNHIQVDRARRQINNKTKSNSGLDPSKNKGRTDRAGLEHKASQIAPHKSVCEVTHKLKRGA